RYYNGSVDLVPFLKGLSVIWLVCFFYISMVIYLGTLVQSRGMVLGIAFLFFLIGMLAPLLFHESYYIMPWKLPDIAFSMSMSIAWSSKIFLAIFVTAVWSLVFIAGALRHMEKIEI
ncbi:MAG: hypothetical protein ACRCUT_04220, partial [Spirochaetota bacterium]